VVYLLYVISQTAPRLLTNWIAPTICGIPDGVFSLIGCFYELIYR